jgi:hypothetical protein
VAEGARLESVFTLTGNVGSNPTLSAASLQLTNKLVRWLHCGLQKMSEGTPEPYEPLGERHEATAVRLKIRVRLADGSGPFLDPVLSPRAT